MALNTSKCNHLTPLRFKGLNTLMFYLKLFLKYIHVHTYANDLQLSLTAVNNS